MSNSEYSALRQELITRLTLLNNQSQTAGIAIITTWSAGIALRVGMVKLYESNYIPEFIIIGIMASFFFLIPVFYFIPLAVKSGENIVQIVSISAYIRVFFDYASCNSNKNQFNWETANNLMSSINVDRKNTKSFAMKRYNGDYSILATCSLILYAMSTMTDIYFILRADSRIVGAELLISGISLLMGIEAIKFIHKVSSAKNTIMNQTSSYVKGYIYHAIRIGFFQEDEIVKIWDRLNPENRIRTKDFADLYCQYKNKEKPHQENEK